MQYMLFELHAMAKMLQTLARLLQPLTNDDDDDDDLTQDDR